MKKINIHEKTSYFFSSLKERNLILHSEQQSSDKKDNKYISFDFKVKYFLMFDKNGLLLINTTISEYTKLSAKFLDRLKMIIMKLSYSNIQNFETIFKHLKIYFFNDNFIYVCIVSSKANSCLIRLYLYFLNIVYLNLIGDNLKNSACLINISKIFEMYFVLTLTSKFCKVIDYILSNKEKNSCKYLYKFKSLLIYYRYKSNIITLFDYRKISYRKELQYKYSIRKNDILFSTMDNLIISPLYKNNYIIKNEIYSNELELYATFPRWMIFGKFFKVYNGLNIIEIFTAKKLSKITTSYKEFDLKEQNTIYDYYKVASRHSHRFIKLMELFTFNYLETVSNMFSKYNNPKNELLYFDIDLLIVTNDVISLKLTEDALINLIYKRLQLYLINKIKFGDHRTSILLEEKNENSNSNSNSNDISISEDKKNEEENESQYTITTISKSFLQIDSSDIFEEIYQKRKSLQLSSFESIDQMFNSSEMSEPFQNISYIRNLNSNNDAYSLLSYKPNDPKRKNSNLEIFSMLEKPGGGGGGEESIHLSKRQTEKKIKLLRERRSSIGPTFNIIVNNNNTSHGKKKKLNKRMSINSFKSIKNNLFNMRKKSIANSNFSINKKKERSNSFTESGLFLKQFYSMMNNSKFLKNKHQILKEIQKKISSVKRNNSLKDLQSEIKLKNNSPFYKSNIKNGKDKVEEKIFNESKTSEHNIQIVKNSSSMVKEENENSINNKNNGGDIIHEYYEDKSSAHLFQNNDSNIFQMLNKKF